MATRRAVAVLAAAATVLALIAAGCGSSSSGSHPSTTASIATPPARSSPIEEIKASGEQVASDLETGRYAGACEGFTTSTRAKLGHSPQGCASVLALAHSVGGAEGRAFAQLFRHALLTRLPRLQIKGDEALYHGNVEVRYEEGRWRFETQGGSLRTRREPSVAARPGGRPRGACRRATAGSVHRERRGQVEINGVAHVVLTVNRFADCVSFYDRLMPELGMQVVYRSDEFVYYVGGRTALAIRRGRSALRRRGL